MHVKNAIRRPDTSFWDGLLGRGETVGSINKDVAEVEQAMKSNEAAARMMRMERKNSN
jgi:hypothetical protein